MLIDTIKIRKVDSFEKFHTPFRKTKEKEASNFKVLLVYPNLPLMLVPPLAIAIFTDILKSAGYQVKLFETTEYLSDKTVSPENRVKLAQARDFDYENDLGIKIKNSDMFKDFSELVKSYEPDVLLFSVVEDAFDQCLGLLESVGELNIPHIVGGVFPIAAPDRVLAESLIKMVGIGEGERVILDFCESIRSNKEFHLIPGTWVKANSGHIFKNEKSPLIDIERQNPDYSLFDERRFYRPMGGHIFKTMPIETYRGCPYKCTFCNSPMHVEGAKESNLGDFLRRKSIPKLREEIHGIVNKFNPEFLYFVDDSFLARPKKEIFEFCDMYEEFKLPFWFNTRPENCRLPEMKRLKEVGAYRISFGIECGNEEYRKKVLHRSVSNKAVIDSFKVIAESNIPFSVNLIIGFPGETRELVMDTVELVRRISGYDTLTVSIFTPYHGTVLRDVAVKNGWLEKNAITQHTTSTSILQMPPPYLNNIEIDGLMRTLPFYCYFDKSEWVEIQKAEINSIEGNKIFDEYRKRYSIEFLGESQDKRNSEKIFSATGCKASDKDSYYISPSRNSLADLSMLNK